MTLCDSFRIVTWSRVNLPAVTTPKISSSFHSGTLWVVVDVPSVTVSDPGGAAV
jgi:hypothetical protein